MSQVFSTLKNVKEKLNKNYSSVHLLNTLDNFLYKAFLSMFSCSTFAENNFLSISAWYTRTYRRSISSSSKEEFNACITLMACARTQEEKLLWLKKSKIERSALFLVIKRFLDFGSRYKDEAYSSSFFKDNTAYLQKQKTLKLLLITDENKLLTCLDSISNNYKLAIELRNRISEKYMRSVMLESQKYFEGYKRNNAVLKVDESEIANSFMIAVLKAINKCDQNKGTLTSQVNNWIKSVKSNRFINIEYGTAYTVPSYHKKEFIGKSSFGNAYVNMDSEEAKNATENLIDESSEELSEDIITLRLLAKEIDPKGYARLSLGIQEVLTTEDLEFFK